MKSKKTKLQDKLTSMKSKKDLPVSEDIDLLEEEVLSEQSQLKTVVVASGESSPVTSVTMPEADSDRTMLTDQSLDSSQSATSPTSPIEEEPEESTQRDVTIGRQTEEKVSYGDVYRVDQANESLKFEGVESVLKQTEHLRLAQDKINDLEKEIEDLRRENDELLSVAETFRRLSDDRHEQLEKLKAEIHGLKRHYDEEVSIRTQSLIEKDKLIHELKQSNADLKVKVETNFKQIRKRERDLEYRLELAKVEEEALLKSKDKTILELRRKNDKMEQDVSTYRDKAKEHYQKLQQQQQTVRSAVRALRIALAGLEGDFGVEFEILKKAE